MFILKRKKKKKNIPSLFSYLSLLIVRLLEFLSVWNTFPLFFPVSLNSATFGISQCLEYFTRLKKEGGALEGEKNKNNLTSLIDTMNVKLISLHKI